jgi:hypothetical protein
MITPESNVASMIDVFLQNPDIWECPIALVVIETEADHEAVGNLEAAILDGNVDQPARRLVQECADRQAARLAAGKDVE